MDELANIDDTPEETKAARFSRLATARINKAAKAIELIGNLAERSRYEYTQEQVDKIASILNEEVAAVLVKFRPAEADEDSDTPNDLKYRL